MIFIAHESRRFEIQKDVKMTLQGLTPNGSSSRRPANEKTLLSSSVFSCVKDNGQS
ncbi:MAG: hypothetical protein QG570_742 [Patescibacteria group bacterium]|nr:hypothetical protein [Patescibacteria group bacterium]